MRVSISTERLGIAVLVTLVAIGVLLAFVARGSDPVFIFLASLTAVLVGLQLPPESGTTLQI
jgi:predicted signal transduction protein with EAL and GGDEF domain